MAHHSIASVIFELLGKHSEEWQIYRELCVSSLRVINTPQDLFDMWNRVVDDLEETDYEPDIGDNSDDGMEDGENTRSMGRLRPDAWGISWSRRQVLILELTRAHDLRQDWYITTDNYKLERYRRLQERMQSLLPQGWTVTTLPLTLGVPGSFDEQSWKLILDRLGFNSAQDQRRFMCVVTRQV
ncbi:MAG: hypothetical protein ACKO7A_05950, partial [Microcystis sp.]